METRLITKKQKPLVNRNIKDPQVLFIDQTGENHGVIDTADAIKLAKESNLDLVVVSQPREGAPVAKAMDHGKLQYQQSKRQKQTSRPSVKEVKFRPNIGESDYELRVKRATEWLSKGDSVKFLVRLRGREHQHRDRATDLLQRVVDDLESAGKVQSFDRRALTLFLSPS
ncbi:translation initiation factor IF-3 [Leptothoe sp. PORK10 BA2]|uniref:translation initiation factor IF-3 n=1 Tax=Leptothoe sp. PORK10 BA2 TaxID=3110254 RepID=UPI002B20E339|nr:translation initiation factor IF-3 [Leptothoe sp. PORK10 BA2]MEA5464115.1 translation initiation factor IF-3 [Leptothoe sp. PORK10 BA2]